MEEQIETRVSPQEVWAAWEKAHALYGQKGIEKGQSGKQKFRYKILDVKKGESFSILWKSLFARLVFSHTVKTSERGSIISYKVQIRGPFGWLIRYLIGAKVQSNLSLVLKSMVKELENKRIE